MANTTVVSLNECWVWGLLVELASEIRLFILGIYEQELSAKGLTPQSVSDDFDLLVEGVIDSIGVLNIVNSVEEKFGIAVDLENLPAEELTVIGPLSEYIA